MIAVYDSGLGGILSLNQIIKDFPNEKIIYFGDSDNAPYGNKNKCEIIDIVNKNIKMLSDLGADDIILACNTICSCVDFNNSIYNLHDIIAKTVKQIELGKDAKILVFATKFSMHEGRYKIELEKNGFQNCEYHFLENLAYYLENFKSKDFIKDYLYQEFSKIDFKPDAIILGCTHYPIVEDIFKEYYNAKIYHSRDLHFDIKPKNDGHALLIKMHKSEKLERFLGTYVDVPYEFYD